MYDVEQDGNTGGWGGNGRGGSDLVKTDTDKIQASGDTTCTKDVKIVWSRYALKSAISEKRSFSQNHLGLFDSVVTFYKC